MRIWHWLQFKRHARRDREYRRIVRKIWHCTRFFTCRGIREHFLIGIYRVVVSSLRGNDDECENLYGCYDHGISSRFVRLR